MKNSVQILDSRITDINIAFNVNPGEKIKLKAGLKFQIAKSDGQPDDEAVCAIRTEISSDDNSSVSVTSQLEAAVKFSEIPEDIDAAGKECCFPILSKLSFEKLNEILKIMNYPEFEF